MISSFRNHRLRLVIILGVSTILSLVGDLTLYATLPVNAGGLLLSLAQIGVLLSANRFIRLVSNPVTGFLLDRGKRRPIFLYGMLLGTLSTLLYGLTARFSVLLLGRLIWGFAWSLINVGSNTMVVDSTTREDRGRYMGILKLMVSLGLSLNPLIGGLLADMLGFRPTMLISASLTGAGFFLALFLLPETRQEMQTVRGSLVKEPAPAISKLKFFRQYSHQILSSFQFAAIGWQTWLAALLTLIAFFAGNGLVMATIGFFLSLELGTGMIFRGELLGITALTGIILGIRSLLVALTSPIGGGFSDRGKTRWPAIQVGLILGIFGMVALGVLRTIPAIVIGIGLISIGEGVLITVLPAVVGDHAAETQRGRAMGLIFVAGDLGSALAPLLVYSILTLVPLRSVYLASAGLFGLGLLLVLARGRLVIIKET